MRISVICRDTRHASSRVRALQYVQPLRELGHDVTVVTWQPTRTREVMALTARLAASARRTDVVFIVKPRLDPRVFMLLRRLQPRLVVDVDDAVWTWPSPFPARFDTAAQGAGLITAGSGHLRTLLTERYPRTRVTVVPTSVDMQRYTAAANIGHERPPVIGWIGGPASLTDFEAPVLQSLQELTREHATTVKIVCSEPLASNLVATEFEPWSAATEVQSLQSFDIGIMPLRDDEQSWGRCGLKLLQYMAVGIPVVASPIGAAVEIVEDGVSGFLPSTGAEWTSALRELAASPALRNEMGARARARVEERYSLTTTLPGLVSALESAAGS